MSHLGERLTGLIDGELGHDERDRALAHLAVCEECRLEAEELRRLKMRLRSMGDPSEPAGMLGRLLAIAEAGEAAELLSAAPVGLGDLDGLDGFAHVDQVDRVDRLDRPGRRTRGQGPDGAGSGGRQRRERSQRRPRRAGRREPSPSPFERPIAIIGGAGPLGRSHDPSVLTPAAMFPSAFSAAFPPDHDGLGRPIWPGRGPTTGTGQDETALAGSSFGPLLPAHSLLPGGGPAPMVAAANGHQDRRRPPRARQFAMSAATFALFGFGAASYAATPPPERAAAPRVAPALQRFSVEYALASGGMPMMAPSPAVERAGSRAIAPTVRPSP